MNLKAITISHKKDLKFTFKSIREKAKDYPNLIKIDKDADLEMVVKDIDPNSTFFFHVSKQEQRDTRIYYHFEYSPASVSSNMAKKNFAVKEAVLSQFSSWISYIKEHNETLDIHPKDKVHKAYVDEFYSKFRMDEEDADEVPFSFDKQHLINAFLEQSILQLSENPEEDSSQLVDEAQYLQHELGSLTKNEVVFRLAEFYAKMRIFSFRIFQAVMEKGVSWGYNKIFDSFFELGG